jgi:hypothetical protein
LPDDALYCDENSLDHRHILAVGGAVFKRADFLAAVREDNPEVLFVKVLLGDKLDFDQDRKINRALKRVGAKDKSLAEYEISLQKEYGEPLRQRFPAKTGKGLTKNLRLFSYPDFGLYIYKSDFLYLAARAGGGVGQNGNGGHAHNDQLGVDLNIDGADIISDPGSYLYTPLPDRRNEFRSTKAHFTPCPAAGFAEQNGWHEGRAGLFGLRTGQVAAVLYIGRDGMVARHKCFGYGVARVIMVKYNCVEIADFAERGIQCGGSKLFSRGYGKCERKR